MRWWPFRKHHRDDRDRKLAEEIDRRLDRQQAEVDELARSLRAERKRNSFRRRWEQTLRGEV